jgi:hypothetical protein
MSRGINWFKDFKIKREAIDNIFGQDIIYSIEFLDGNSTSFSEGNITKYQDAFKKYGNISIPYIEYEYYSEPSCLKKILIDPKILSEVCSQFLSDNILAEGRESAFSIIGVKLSFSIF